MNDNARKLTVAFGDFTCVLEGFSKPFAMQRMVLDQFQILSEEDPDFGDSAQVGDIALLEARLIEAADDPLLETKVEGNTLTLRRLPEPVAEEVEETKEAKEELPKETSAKPRKAKKPATKKTKSTVATETPEEESQVEPDDEETHISAPVAQPGDVDENPEESAASDADKSDGDEIDAIPETDPETDTSDIQDMDAAGMQSDETEEPQLSADSSLAAMLPEESAEPLSAVLTDELMDEATSSESPEVTGEADELDLAADDDPALETAVSTDETEMPEAETEAEIRSDDHISGLKEPENNADTDANTGTETALLSGDEPEAEAEVEALFLTDVADEDEPVTGPSDVPEDTDGLDENEDFDTFLGADISEDSDEAPETPEITEVRDHPAPVAPLNLGLSSKPGKPPAETPVDSDILMDIPPDFPAQTTAHDFDDDGEGDSPAPTTNKSSKLKSSMFSAIGGLVGAAQGIAKANLTKTNPTREDEGAALRRLMLSDADKPGAGGSPKAGDRENMHIGSALKKGLLSFGTLKGRLERAMHSQDDSENKPEIAIPPYVAPVPEEKPDKGIAALKLMPTKVAPGQDAHLPEEQVDRRPEPLDLGGADHREGEAKRTLRIIRNEPEFVDTTPDGEAEETNGEREEEFIDDGETNLRNFAHRVGAKTLPELLEAAAAYAAIIDQIPRFTRQQVTTMVDGISRPGAYTAEAKIKSFGKLQRNGTFLRMEGGLFALDQNVRLDYERQIEDW